MPGLEIASNPVKTGKTSEQHQGHRALGGSTAPGFLGKQESAFNDLRETPVQSLTPGALRPSFTRDNKKPEAAIAADTTQVGTLNP